MTKDEFIKGYCELSKISIETFNESEVALPCDCGYANCKGWAAVSNRPRSIKAHRDLYIERVL